MTGKKTTAKSPPKDAIQSVQYDLFAEFLTNDEKKISNTVELWECIPKYFFTPKQMEKMRTKDGLSRPYQWNYTYNNTDFSVHIQPALLKQKNGNYKAFFPGVTEELVEEALKKIFSNQKYGVHDPDNRASWVRFSLSMIHKELKRLGRERNRNQIKLAIEVMSSCIITLYKEGKEFWKGSILQDLITVGREKYLAETDSYHMARLPLFISHSINILEYRQFNYARFMSCDEQLARWIYKQLIHRYTNANFTNTYHFLFSSVAKDSGLLQQETFHKNRTKLNSALCELKEQGIIAQYSEEIKKEGRKMVNAKYTVQPSLEFISEQKAANKRLKDSIETAKKTGITVPDDSSILKSLSKTPY